MSFLSGLACGACHEAHDARALQNVCRKCGKPLLARYDIEAAKERVSRDEWERGRDDLWRFADILPVRRARHIISLGEGMTPLLLARRLAEHVGLPQLMVKDESGNPTGSFKARGMTAAVSKAVELGVTRLAVPSAGNAGAALSAYAARADVPADIYLPADTPAGITRACQTVGATVHAVDGLITDAGALVRARAETGEVFDVSTLKEPYRVEGKKTMGIEVVLQNGWEMPDVIIYPTGGGTGIVGMWKAFDEMEQLGLIGSHRPRMIAVQTTGCAPLVRAFQEGDTHAEEWADAKVDAGAWGLRVPKAIGDFLILRALRESDGGAVAVTAEQISAARDDFARFMGLDVSPEGAATLAATRLLVAEDLVAKDETVVLFQTGAAWPYQ